MINFLPLFCFFQKNSQIEFDASYHKKYYNFSFFFYFYILYKFKIILNPIKHFYHCYKSQKINIFIPKRSKSIQLKLNYFHFKTYIFTQNRRHYISMFCFNIFVKKITFYFYILIGFSQKIETMKTNLYSSNHVM